MTEYLLHGGNRKRVMESTAELKGGEAKQHDLIKVDDHEQHHAYEKKGSETFNQ